MEIVTDDEIEAGKSPRGWVHEKDTRSMGCAVAATERLENGIEDRKTHAKPAETIKTNGDLAGD